MARIEANVCFRWGAHVALPYDRALLTIVGDAMRNPLPALPPIKAAKRDGPIGLREALALLDGPLADPELPAAEVETRLVEGLIALPDEVQRRATPWVARWLHAARTLQADVRTTRVLQWSRALLALPVSEEMQQFGDRLTIALSTQMVEKGHTLTFRGLRRAAPPLATPWAEAVGSVWTGIPYWSPDHEPIAAPTTDIEPVRLRLPAAHVLWEGGPLNRNLLLMRSQSDMTRLLRRPGGSPRAIVYPRRTGVPTAWSGVVVVFPFDMRQVTVEVEHELP